MNNQSLDHKLVVITNGNYFSRLILEDFLQEFKPAIQGILIVTGDYRGNTGLRALWEIGKVTAFPYLVFKIISLLAFKFAQFIKPSSAYSVEKLAAQLEIPVKSLNSIKSLEAIQWVVNQHADLVISVSCPQMIGKKILNAAPLGGINIHSSLLPAYAGLAPYFWVLSAREKETGTTVHFMTQKFDEGNILIQTSTPIKPKESSFSLFKRLAILGRGSLVQATKMALNQDPGIQQDLSNLSYFSNPTFSAYKSLKQNGHVLIYLGEVLDVLIGRFNSDGDD